MSGETILAIKELGFSYGPTEALSGVTFEVRRGDYIGLAGPNGAGKTTLIKVMLGLLPDWRGRIELFGTEASQFRDWRRIGFLPQRVNVFNPLFPATVSEVVGLGLLSQKKFPKRMTAADRDQILATLAAMDIVELKDRIAGELSGGQQQRVFLARALVSNPELLILDEPGTALDPVSADNFFALLRKLNSDRGITMIIITHDLAQIGEYAHKLLYLNKRVIFYGGFNDFCQSEDMTRYFGHAAQHLICHQH